MSFPYAEIEEKMIEKTKMANLMLIQLKANGLEIKILEPL